MKASVTVITKTVVFVAIVGLIFGTTSAGLPSASAAPPESPLQTLSHVTIQNTTTSNQYLLGLFMQEHQASSILPLRTDGKVWVGTVTWTSSKPVELVVLHRYTNVTADSVHGVPVITGSASGPMAVTLITPSQFSPASDPVPSGTAPFVGSVVAFHTLSGAKFTVTYSVDATANSPTKTK